MAGAGSSPAGSAPAGVGEVPTGTPRSGDALVDPNTQQRTGARRIDLRTGDYVIGSDVLEGMPPVAQKMLLASRNAARRLREIPRIGISIEARVRALVLDELAPLTEAGEVEVIEITTRRTQTPQRLAIRIRWRDRTTDTERETDVG